MLLRLAKVLSPTGGALSPTYHGPGVHFFVLQSPARPGIIPHRGSNDDVLYLEILESIPTSKHNDIY